MFARVTVHASELEASRRFYETLLGGDWGRGLDARDLAASRRFRESVAGPLALRFSGAVFERFHLAFPAGSAFSVLDPDGNTIEGHAERPAVP